MKPIINEQVKYKQYTFTNDSIIDKPTSIGLPYYRTDGVRMPNKLWFPKSQLKITPTFSGVRLLIPQWLLDSKLGNSYVLKGY